MSVNIPDGSTDWSPTDPVRYPDLDQYEEERNRARERGAALPVEVKWKTVTTGLPLSTAAREWLDRAVIETFGSLPTAEDPIDFAVVPGMDAYNIVLYLAMELRRISAMLRVSTIAEEAGLRRYADLMNQIADAEPQPAGGARTTNLPDEAYVSQEPNAGASDRLSLASGHADLLKSDRVLAGKMATYSGRPVEAEPFLKDFKNCTRSMSDAERIRWFAVLVGPECSEWFEQQEWTSWAELEESFLRTHSERLTSVDALEKTRLVRQGATETVTSYVRRFGKLLPYLRKEIATPSIIEAMINGLRQNLIVASAASDCRNMTWGRAVAHLEALELRLPKIGRPTSARGVGSPVHAGPTVSPECESHPARESSQPQVKREAVGADDAWQARIEGFKRRCAFPDSTGCWICNGTDHGSRSCPKRGMLRPPSGNGRQG